MGIKIALAGNPNCGKTTLFNALTGSNQSVGNWPGVTVEKKEGGLKKHDDVVIMDLPGIYSLSPYTLEEVVARNYLVDERPDAILNIVDGTNLERNLYLTTQLAEIGIPVVIAINMMDVVKKNGDKIDTAVLSKELGCKVFEISALKSDGIIEAAEAAIEAAKESKPVPMHTFSGAVEHALAHIEEAVVHEMPEEQQRWYAIKVFERDEKVMTTLNLSDETRQHVEKDINRAEKELDDDSESIITNERYNYITAVLKTCYKKKNQGGLSTSDKIDKIVTSRWLGLPIFAIIMFLVYFISMQAVGSVVTDWANDGLFGDGWHLLGIGGEQFEDAERTYGDSDAIIEAFAKEYGNDNITAALDAELDNYTEKGAETALASLVALTPENANVTYMVEDEETLEVTENPYTTKTQLERAVQNYLDTDYKISYGAPDPSAYGVWVPGVPVLIGNGLEAINCADWLTNLILDGIVAGVGSVLSFVPQLLILFLLLGFLESCGYMSRIAFVLDRLFRKFGLSGKSFIPMLVGTGCGVPGIMASRTIENLRDRRMTIITTTFIPCGAKVPFIAMIAGAVFHGSPWVATSAYFIGMLAIIVSGLILKKTKPFIGEPAPFVMELPAYHMPTVPNLLRSMWERGWSFIKKAGTVILVFSIIIWFTTYFGFIDGTFRMLSEDELSYSILAIIGNCIAWIFTPLGWGEWQPAVASMTGIIAKENIVSTLGILYGGTELGTYNEIANHFTAVSAFSFLVFNLLCAPCVAAIGAIRREMNSTKWTLFAVGYQCAFAYAISLMINQFGGIFTGNINILGLIFAAATLIFMIYMLARPYEDSTPVKLKTKAK